MRTWRGILQVGCAALALFFVGVGAYAGELPEQALSHANPRVQEVIKVQKRSLPN